MQILKRYDTKDLIYKTQTDLENKLMVAGEGKDGGRMVEG